ncbi:hypothetical protein UY3_04306 [Chelonia mydas]|uniref:Reverse transcriptase domain-containing protein n=1 Tax=Chelonia mydas TaxID=8469 RepID=M7BKU0_CHEMY|nr:hypothetical protein UY3_04306 [Chelonia mydas]
MSLSPCRFQREPRSAEPAEAAAYSENRQQHKIMLFADDALVFVSKPEVTIPNLLPTINNLDFSQDIKLIGGKSEILDINKYAHWHLFSNWATLFLKYLGILIPKIIQDIPKINLEPIIVQVTNDLGEMELVNPQLVA